MPRCITAPTIPSAVSTGAWPYVALGLVATLLVAGIAGGLAARRDGLCCNRGQRPADPVGEVDETRDEIKRRERQVVEPKQFGMPGGMIPEEGADPDLILLTTGGE